MRVIVQYDFVMLRKVTFGYAAFLYVKKRDFHSTLHCPKLKTCVNYWKFKFVPAVNVKVCQ